MNQIHYKHAKSMTVKLNKYTYSESIHILNAVDFQTIFLMYIYKENYILNNFKQRTQYQNIILNKHLYITIQ